MKKGTAMKILQIVMTSITAQYRRKANGSDKTSASRHAGKPSNTPIISDVKEPVGACPPMLI